MAMTRRRPRLWHLSVFGQGGHPNEPILTYDGLTEPVTLACSPSSSASNADSAVPLICVMLCLTASPPLTVLSVITYLHPRLDIEQNPFQ